MCGGATAFTPSKDGDCWVCATGSAATSVAAGSWSGLTVGSSPADFRCLACVDPPSDIEGWWSFDSTSTPGADISVNGNDGTISGATQVSGKSSWALSFDGVNDTVQIPDDSTLDIGTGSLSFDAWVKISSATDVGGTRVLLDKRSVSGTKYTGYHVFLHSGALAIQLADGSGTSGWTNYICSYKVPTDGKWHLVAITVERVTSGVITFYGVECPRAR
jgi:hypothetical protein